MVSYQIIIDFFLQKFKKMLERVIGGIDHVERKMKKALFTIHEKYWHFMLHGK